MSVVCTQFMLLMLVLGFGRFSVRDELRFALFIVEWPVLAVRFGLGDVVFLLIQVFGVILFPSFGLNFIIITITDFLTFTCTKIP